MALKISNLKDASEAAPALVQPGQRLFLTETRDELVEEGDERARYLYCTESGRVPREEFERLAAGPKAEEKEGKAKPADKSEKTKPADKGAE